MTSSAIFTPRSLASRPRPACLAQDPTNGGQDFRRELGDEPSVRSARTYELGTFVGIRLGNQLAARTDAAAVTRKPFWAQCRALIVARGETPFLHVFSENAPTIALYHRMGGIRPRKTRTPRSMPR